MGLPKINIIFRNAGISAIQRSIKGIVALILRDAEGLGVISMETIDEIPEELSESNKEQIKLAMMGTVNPPKKVIAYVIPAQMPKLAEEGMPAASYGYNEAFAYLETAKWDYLAIPDIYDEEVRDVATWIKQLRDTKNKKVKAVLPNCAADHEGIINFTTTNIKVKDNVYSAGQYASRIAGILAGLPLNISSTYQVLPEVEDIEPMSKSELDEVIDKGQLVLMNDGEKIKIARGVNSLITTTVDKSKEFKKIKIVDTMDMIYTDIKKTAEENYIGKVPNTYDNKCLVTTAINEYYAELENTKILDPGKNRVEIDIAAQKSYLKSIGEYRSDMTQQEIKEANTDDKVFLVSSIKIVDAVEEISLIVNM